MKVILNKDKFIPFTITITCEDEAAILWHLLNNSSTQFMKKSVSSVYIPWLRSQMWNILDNCYRPKNISR